MSTTPAPPQQPSAPPACFCRCKPSPSRMANTAWPPPRWSRPGSSTGRGRWIGRLHLPWRRLLVAHNKSFLPPAQHSIPVPARLHRRLSLQPAAACDPCAVTCSGGGRGPGLYTTCARGGGTVAWALICCSGPPCSPWRPIYRC